ncbi:hypothetical protein [Marilutibacter aestuarii]|uniref:Uncharacterized protein n=1 Tax=Marilutibacter aestuarii TaxID=1706195 RepID=A0A508A5F9_9GAMM|nr:hypothetical protein [Lysobacter aestuarii]TQD45186.1 hypothetical protein FKV25_08935 [Lysobacter aestuarii]
MNVKLRLALLSLPLLGLSACASAPAQRTAPAPERSSSNAMAIDEEYVAYVERVARRRGISVTWVHQPRPQLPRTSTDE